MSSVSPPDAVETLRRLIAEVMEVESITLGADQRETLRAVGRLREPAHEAFARLRPRFEDTGHTPFMRREDGQDVVVAVRQVFRPSATPGWPNLVLFLLTIVSVLYVGTTYGIETAPLTVEKFVAALPTGMLFAVSMLGILGAHEMGHYLMARRHGVCVTLPYFIPLPILLGTMGAVIAMQEPSPNRRVQFDIGVAGPIAGLVVAIPVLIIGLVLSPVYTQQEFISQLPPSVLQQAQKAQEEISPVCLGIRLPPGAGATQEEEASPPCLGYEYTPEVSLLTQEGNSLLYLGLKYAIFGKILPTPAGEDVLIHAMAWAGWGGLLVTAFNLMPVGQLDGGHVMYGLAGERAQMLRWPIIIVLSVMSLVYVGWLLWVFLILVLARRSAPVLDEITDLDAPRRLVAVAMLIIFVLIFVPVPLQAVPLP